MTTLWQYSPEDAWLFGDDEIDDAAELALTPSASGLSAAAFVQNEFFNPSDGVIGELDEGEDSDTLSATGTVVSPPGSLPDPFDGTALQSGWAAPAVSENGGTPTVGSGVASGSGSSARWTTAFGSGVQTITVVIPSAPSDYAAVGLLFLDGSTQNGYVLYCRQEPGDFQVFFSRFTAGASVGIASEFVGSQSYPLTIVGTYDPSTDTFGIALNGSAKTPRTHSTYTNLTHAGFLIDSNATITSFDASPMSGGGITATLAVTEGDDTLAASATVRISGSLATTEGADTLSGVAALSLAGTLSVTEADDTAAAAAGLRISGSLGATEADDALAALGTIGSAPITGAAAITEADDTLAAVGGLRIAGSLAVTEAADTLAAVGALRVAGSLATTEQDDTLAGTGLIGNAPITGALSVTEVGDTLAAAAGLRVTGSLSATEAADTLSGFSTLRIAGALIAAESDDSLIAVVALKIIGSLSVFEANDTLNSSATLEPVTTAHLLVALTLLARNGQLEMGDRSNGLTLAARDGQIVLEDRGTSLHVRPRSQGLTVEP